MTIPRIIACFSFCFCRKSLYPSAGGRALSLVAPLAAQSWLMKKLDGRNSAAGIGRQEVGQRRQAAVTRTPEKSSSFLPILSPLLCQILEIAPVSANASMIHVDACYAPSLKVSQLSPSFLPPESNSGLHEYMLPHFARQMNLFLSTLNWYPKRTLIISIIPAILHSRQSYSFRRCKVRGISLNPLYQVFSQRFYLRASPQTLSKRSISAYPTGGFYSSAML